MGKSVLIELVTASVDLSTSESFCQVVSGVGSAKWATSKGLDGVTVIIGMMALSAISALTKALIKYIEIQKDVLIEVTVDKRKYKIKGLSSKDAALLLESISKNIDGA